MSFARDDLENANSQRGFVNAISNAKRALHLQVDILSNGLGFGHYKKGKIIPFPQKLEFCVNCGVVTPQIISKLNRLRNSVEHEYYLPSSEEAEDFVDIVELFIGYTRQIVYEFPYEVELISPPDERIHNIQTDYIHIDFPPTEGVIKIRHVYCDVDIAWLNQRSQEILENFEEREKGRKEILIYLDDDKKTNALKHALIEAKNEHLFEINARKGLIYCQWVKFIMSKVDLV